MHLVHSQDNFGSIELSSLYKTLNEKEFFTELRQYFEAIFPDEKVLVFTCNGGDLFDICTYSNTLTLVENPKSFISRHVYYCRKPYYSNNSDRDPLYSSILIDRKDFSELCLPVCFEDEVIATIHFLRKVRYSDADVKLKETY